MARYQVWNGTDNIITPSGRQFTAEEWGNKFAWAKLPGAKMIITTPPINGGVALEWNATVANYKKQGVVITDDMTDEEVLTAIEKFEDNPPAAEPTAEERIAAALEFQNAMSL